MLRLDADTLTRVLKLGAKIQKLIRGEPATAKAKAQARARTARA